jgi:hypothetical protein
MPRQISGGFRRRRRVADSMTPDLLACVDRSLAAERAGDLVTALEWHQSVPMFLKGRHRQLMTGLTDLEGDLPGWVWARLIAYQTTRCEDGALGRDLKDLLQDVAERFHGDLLEECFRGGGDPIRVAARVVGESWAFHQISVHEGDGLRRFVDEFATGRLAEHADLALRWAGSRMSGYRIGESLPRARLTVREAGTGTPVEVVDLGARSCSPDGWVLGRLVPSGVGDDLMFDMPPLPVPEAVAEAVAGAAGDWWGAVVDACRRGLLSPRDFLREDYALTCDVPELELLRFGTEPRDLGRVTQQLRDGRDEISRAAYRVLDRARRGDVAASDQAYVGAAALNVHAFADMRRETLRAGAACGAVWATWAARVAGPARGRLLRLADGGRSAA